MNETSDHYRGAEIFGLEAPQRTALLVSRRILAWLATRQQWGYSGLVVGGIDHAPGSHLREMLW